MNKNPLKLAITIPAYNEEATIGNVIREIPRTIEGIDKVEVIVINDGSRDRTVEAATEAGADPIVQFPTNKGLNAATDCGADIIVNIEAPPLAEFNLRSMVAYNPNTPILA
ncbi:MAG: glycosyltransferase [Candidatus Methanoperedens sp.]|nr:glycosyltransferase [Candidatus Methanoperedens sp.]